MNIMEKSFIKNIIATRIAGQGNQVDLGSALPEILNGLVDGLFVEPVAYEDLKSKRDKGELVIGSLYRITDYVATTIQPGTRSANHPFDLIVTAVTEKELDAHAIAVPHDGDHYFDGFKLTAWNILYTLDNDDRYTWALTDHLETGDSTLFRRPFYDKMADGGKLYGYWDMTNETQVFFSEEITKPGTYEDADGNEVTVESFEKSTGKGVIYHLEDEFGNERQFDFKGIQFLRDEDWCGDHSDFVDSELDGVSKDWWFYPLSWVAEDGTVQDLSLVGNNGTLKNDEGRVNGCYETKVGYVSAILFGGIDGLFSLDQNVMISSYSYDGGPYYGTYGITMKSDCSSNTFGNSCSSDTFGDGCSSNTFGDGCSSNTFGDGCYSNTFGNSCSSNTFGDGCHSNTFGDGCSSNTFGDGCHSNTFGDGCSSNTFGNSCSSNTFGDGCHSNTFGGDCYSNTFGDGCYSNTFGNSCSSDTFGDNPDNVRFINGLNGVHNKTITVVANADYCQFVGLDTDGTLKVWNPADNV